MRRVSEFVEHVVVCALVLVLQSAGPEAAAGSAVPFQSHMRRGGRRRSRVLGGVPPALHADGARRHDLDHPHD